MELPIVISVGGSLIVPNGGIDVDFLKRLNELVRREVACGKRFFLIAGGGYTARHYQDAGRGVIGHRLIDEDLDWIGIHATRLNAHLLRTIFVDIAHPQIIKNYDEKLRDLKEPVVIGSGWKPGWSTDYDAMILARDYGAKIIINLSNIDWVYDRDPNKYPDAKPIKKMSWQELQELVGTEWKPGTNAAFDPIAVKLGKELGATVVITSGRDLENVTKIIEGKDFKGTVITSG